MIVGTIHLECIYLNITTEGDFNSMSVFRIYVEKKPSFDVEAQSTLSDVKTALRLEGLQSIRIR